MFFNAPRRLKSKLPSVPTVAVRSSALGEDGQDASFAGQQETYLWVRGAGHVCDAVRDCWVSLYSPPAITYRARRRSTSRRVSAPATTTTRRVIAIMYE